MQLSVGRIFGSCLLPAFASSFLGDLCVLCGPHPFLAFKRITDFSPEPFFS